MESVYWVTREQREDEDFRHKVELRMSDGNNNFSMDFNALIDTGSPIFFVKKCYVPCKFVVVDTSRDRFCGVNGSGLRIIGRINVTLSSDLGKYDVVLRVVPDDTLKGPLLLERDFIKLAKLTLSGEEEITDILKIELISDDACTTSQEMRLNEDLAPEIKMRAHNLFENHYANAVRSSNPVVENVMELTLLESKPFSCTPRKLSFSEKTELKSILD